MTCPHCGEQIDDVYLDPTYFTVTFHRRLPGAPDSPAQWWIEGVQRCPSCRGEWEVQDSGP